MNKCKNCGEDVKDGYLFGCDGCQAYYCEKCANSTKMICPSCYSSLEIKG